MKLHCIMSNLIRPEMQATEKCLEAPIKGLTGKRVQIYIHTPPHESADRVYVGGNWIDTLKSFRLE